MNTGFAVLYLAFAAVALWLLAELLLQHRAPVRWRALALAGFLLMAGGVVARNVPVIAVGTLGFGAGQYLVTRAVSAARRGEGAEHWALRRGAAPEPDDLPEQQPPAAGGQEAQPEAAPADAPSAAGAAQARAAGPQEPAGYDYYAQGQGQGQGQGAGQSQGQDYAGAGYPAPQAQRYGADPGSGGWYAGDPSAAPVYAPQPMPEDPDTYGSYLQQPYAQEPYPQQPYAQPGYPPGPAGEGQGGYPQAGYPAADPYGGYGYDPQTGAYQGYGEGYGAGPAGPGAATGYQPQMYDDPYQQQAAAAAYGYAAAQQGQTPAQGTPYQDPYAADPYAAGEGAYQQPPAGTPGY